MNAIYHKVVYKSTSWRKRVVLCCRAQYCPSFGSPPYTLLHKQCGFDRHDPNDVDVETRDLSIFFKLYRSYIVSPYFASLVINICLAAPFLDYQKNKEIKDSWGKEISVMESQPLPSYFNYKVWFDRDCVNQPFCPDLPPNPEISSYIHNLLVIWREECCSKVHFPRASNRTMAHNTIRKVTEFLGLERWENDTQGLFTQKTLMDVQHTHRRRFEGVTEIRQKWYRSKLAPRTYFAMGATAWNASKCLQGVFNDLVDSLISTNYLYRLTPTRIKLDRGENLRIWDLSSFTSNHHESRHFLLQLSSFCAGFRIKLMDEVDGLVEVDFGNLLGIYAQQNCYPEYTLERCDDFYAELVSFHHVAGFLGVYGNLPSSTFLHGASVLEAVGDPDKLNAAGDDGHCASMPGTYKDYTIGRTVRRNGIVEEEKLFWTYEEGAVCLKRGLVQIGNYLVQKEMILWPSISLLLEGIFGPEIDHHHRSPIKRSKTEIKSAIASEMMRFLNSIFLHNQQFGLPLEYITQFCNTVWSSCGLPREGSVPQLGGTFLCPIVPRDISYFEHSPLRQVISYHYSGTVELPLRGSTDSFDNTTLVNIPGWFFTANSTPYLGFLESLGYVTSEPVKRYYFDLDGFDRLVKEFSTSLPSVLEYQVVKSIPAEFEYN